MTEYIAHSKNQFEQRQDLEEHLRTVAEVASRFAESFGVSELAHYIGLWHDIGKFNPKFQEYLLRCEADPSAKGTGPDHKAAGARLALQYLAPLALLAQGHHGGLKSPGDMETWLKKKEDQASLQAMQTARTIIAGLEPSGTLPIPQHVNSDPIAAELFLRLLFSALVDADYLDTEAHFNGEKTVWRESNVSLMKLWERLEAAQKHKSGHGTDIVSTVRHEIYEACLEAGELPPGFFRLTVPTGGGKTLSGMAFALRHALRYGHQRVIVAVPFITITEQTAATYRSIFAPIGEAEGEQAVLEHHSGGLHDLVEDEDFHPAKVWQRLAAENWDAPIIVTTTVQLFESLFANNTSPCRKVHRLARSVIILDEAQALPPALLRPILNALQQLCAYYGTTVIISTATQPAFDTIPDFRSIQATEIVRDHARHFALLKRVGYEWHTDQPLSWEEVAGVMREEAQALAVLNTKKDAIALLDALADPDALHLSTLLCGAHRRKVIEEVRRRLQDGEPCHLVSTQVVEAGVDLDFPLVLRALGPLDGIIQAAGRCNREGKLPLGRVVIFRPQEGGMPQGAYRTGADITRALLGKYGEDLDPDDPQNSRRYFQQLYDTLDIDRERIQKLRSRFEYMEVAKHFQMIPDDTESVVICYSPKPAGEEHDKELKELDRLLNSLRYGTSKGRYLLRKLQPYTVSLRTRQAKEARDLIEPVVPGVGRWLGEYDPVHGLIVGLNLDMLVI